MNLVIDNPQSFHAEAMYQLVCAVCGRGGAFHAHHVVPKGELRKRHLPLNDTRNALRLCAGLDGNNCHMQFEWAGPGKVLVLQKHLRQSHFCYIWSVMRMAGVNLLERKYGGADDPRWAKHMEGDCACQTTVS